MSARDYNSRRVITGYVSVSVLFTLASSVIWAINTVFLLQKGGLDIFQVMIVNAVFTVGQMVFEVPTGVIADTIGRRASLLLCMGTLTVATALYALTPRWGWGIWGFIGASVLIGLGFTFETGALDAWLVDALDASGWTGPKDGVFARGQMAAGGGMLVGSLLGGLLGQIGLSWPYVVRTVLLVAAGVVTALLVHDAGFTPRPLRAATFGDETRRIMRDGVTFGWKSPVVRPLMWGSLAGGVFFIYAFYSWQPYVLDLLGHNDVWLLGVVTAAFSLTGIGGNLLVKRIMRTGDLRRSPAEVLMVGAIVSTVLAFAIAAVGLVYRQPGVLPAAVAIGLWLLFGLVFGLTSPIRHGVHQRPHPLGPTGDRPLTRRPLRRHRRDSRATSTGLDLGALLDPRGLADRRGLPRNRPLLLPHVGPRRGARGGRGWGRPGRSYRDTRRLYLRKRRSGSTGRETPPKVRQGDAGSGQARADSRDRALDRDERPRHSTRQEEPFGEPRNDGDHSKEVITMSVVFLIFVGLVIYWTVTDRQGGCTIGRPGHGPGNGPAQPRSRRPLVTIQKSAPAVRAGPDPHSSGPTT